MTSRNHARERDPLERSRGFDEVSLGYTVEQAVAEASRCLHCKKAPCSDGCPVGVDISSFISLIKQDKPAEAAAKIKEVNSLPAVCGRVCPQENQCEKLCTLGKKGEPVAIGLLERYAADHGENIESKPFTENTVETSGKKVAVVGSGPAGLTAAAELARYGHSVTVFEALHRPGGVLVYGIPEFRLPKSIVDREIEYIASLGVSFKTNFIIGRTRTVAGLLSDGFEAVFLANGAGLPAFLGIPGENLNGVYSASEFLTRTNLMKAYLFPEYQTPVKHSRKVAVVGGGNVAIDSARTALRLGAENVYLIYRRSEHEMPARAEEIEHARQEGVTFKMLETPVSIKGDDSGAVKSIECVSMALGEPDEDGRRRPEPLSGSEHEIDAGQVIIAIGQAANPLLTSATEGLELDGRGNIVADELGATNLPGVYAGGDIVSGAATVIKAMGAGRESARAIDAYLRERKS